MQIIIALLLLLFLPVNCLAESAVPPTVAGVTKDTLIAAVPADLPPTYFKDPATGKAEGFAIDVMDEIARRAGRRVVYVFGKPWDEMIEMVRIGKADIIPHLTISPDRQELLDFTAPIEVVPVGLIVTHDSRITGFSPGLRVGILKGSIPENYMHKHIPTVEVVPYEDMTKVLFSLLAGQIDAAFVLNPNLMKLAYDAGVEGRIKVLSPPIFESRRGIALRKDDNALRDRLNTIVTKFVGSPEYAGLFSKWYGHPQPYWTAARISLIMGSGLFLVVIITLYWRYYGIARLNREVLAAVDAMQATFNAVNDALIMHDLNTGAILDVNMRMCEMYGYDHDEALQITMADLSSGTLPYAKDDAIAWMKKAAQGGPQLFKWHARRKDGSLFWVEVNMRMTAIGGKGRVIVAVRDIADRMKAEQALRESEGKFRAVFEGAKDGIWLLSSDSNVVALNTSFAMMHGWTVEEMLKMNLKEFDTPESAALAPARMQRMFAGEPMSFEVEHFCKNGQTIPIEVSANMVVIDNEKYILAFHRNIAERKKSEELIRGILESVDEGFIIVDRDFGILSANKAYANMIKRPIEDIIGRHCYEVSHHTSASCDLPMHACAVKQVFEIGKPSTCIHVHRDEKGEPAYIETKAYPLSKDGAGAVVTAIETLIDVTERRKLEDQLRQSQKMESIGTLAGGIAHDFNNILTAIVGYGNIALKKMAKDDPQRLNIEHVLDAANRAAHLTKDLLLFSRKQISEKKPVDLNEIVRKTEKFLKRVIGEDIDCRTSIINEALPVLGDSHQLEQVLMNLATNARDAMQTGGVFTITTELVKFGKEFISVHGYGKPGSYVLITVSDTGKGMDEVTREHIFEPFFTTKDVGKGTGLGLAVVYGIIKQHDGFINVYSEPGLGSTFKIYLPLIASRVHEEKIIMEEPPLGGTESILLAEDDETVRNMTRTVLEQYGYAVIAASDGQEAVNKYKEHRDKIQLLLFDLVMPKKTGKEAYEEIRALTPGMKVLFSSGYAPDIIRQKVLLEDRMPIVFKPITPTELLNKVRETLDRG